MIMPTGAEGKMMEEYDKFISSKSQMGDMGGFEPNFLPDTLFPFQRFLTEWAIRQGRGAIFADCGMGKTLMELVWATNVHRRTGKPVLLVTPIAVGFQVKQEGEKFGIESDISREGKVVSPITITNYERLEKFDPYQFAGVVCDESSAIKSFDGVRRAVVTEFLRNMPYRLLGTATAAPNDYTELGTSSEALGELGHIEMLNRYFVNANRTSDTRTNKYRKDHDISASGWRFKGHAEESFWRWVSSWARAIRKPSDYGFSDEGFVLPPLETRVHIVHANRPAPGKLFDVPAVGLSEEREELRRTIEERCEAAARSVSDASCVVAWCNLNDESKRLAKLIPGAVELSGSDSVEEKEEKLLAFSSGEIKSLVTKPVIGAWGLNWQHCNRMVYMPSHSYEQYYQSIRRSWRFGQKNPVRVDLITTEGGANTLANLTNKASRADVMFESLVRHMSDSLKVQRGNNYDQEMTVPSWL